MSSTKLISGAIEQFLNHCKKEKSAGNISDVRLSEITKTLKSASLFKHLEEIYPICPRRKLIHDPVFLDSNLRIILRKEEDWIGANKETPLQRKNKLQASLDKKLKPVADLIPSLGGSPQKLGNL